MLKPDFLFHQTIRVQPWLGRGVNANRYGPEVTYRCRVDFRRKRTYRRIERAAQEVIAVGTAYLPAGARVPPESLIWLDGQRYSALACRICLDPLSGEENHVEVDIQ